MYKSPLINDMRKTLWRLKKLGARYYTNTIVPLAAADFPGSCSQL